MGRSPRADVADRAWGLDPQLIPDQGLRQRAYTIDMPLLTFGAPPWPRKIPTLISFGTGIGADLPAPLTAGERAEGTALWERLYGRLMRAQDSAAFCSAENFDDMVRLRAYWEREPARAGDLKALNELLKSCGAKWGKPPGGPTPEYAPTPPKQVETPEGGAVKSTGRGQDEKTVQGKPIPPPMPGAIPMPTPPPPRPEAKKGEKKQEGGKEDSLFGRPGGQPGGVPWGSPGGSGGGGWGINVPWWAIALGLGGAALYISK